MENFKEGYWWYKYKSNCYCEWLNQYNNTDGFELIQYLGKDINEFYNLFKIKAS